MYIQDIIKKYRSLLDYLDLEIIISYSINKTREFVLTYPLYKLNPKEEKKIKENISRRIQKEPLAYIIGYKEFYSLKFKVNQNTLIPRPETELLVDIALKDIKKTHSKKNVYIIDTGTGSGNIIISLAKNINNYTKKHCYFYALDISSQALTIAKENALYHQVKKEIVFLKSDLLKKIITKKFLYNKENNIFVLANLPYLSQKNYLNTDETIKKYEPRLALVSGKNGLFHYEKLFQQIKFIQTKQSSASFVIILEFSPEQKTILEKIINFYFPKNKLNFYQDLQHKTRLVKIKL